MTLVDLPVLGLIPLLPLLGAVYAGLFGARLQRRFGEWVVHVPTVALPWGSFLVAAWSFLTLARAGHEAAVYHSYFPWFDVGWLRADAALLMDRLSGVMCLVVTFVGSLIHVYSRGYMRGDPGYWRFFAYLNLFLFAMLVLVLGDSFLLVFVGWEGVGLCSYLLIGFWYRDREKSAAGMKAFVVNRIGDAGFVLGLALLCTSLGATFPGSPEAADTSAVAATPAEAPANAELGAGRGAGTALGVHAEPSEPLPRTSVKFREVERIVTNPERQAAFLGQEWVGVPVVTLICLLLFLGAVGKSAQIPLFVWLPDAMAGPTPVSALIHAATMVTAGVYLVARLHFLFALSPVAMTVVTMTGACTALFAATIGLLQHDIKKVLAYSTVSQLGFMFVAVGVGAYWVGIFHLVTHAFFKACLFLCAGSVIVGCHHEQDMRRMGGLRRAMPITAVTYLVACLAIAGFPPFSGFFSKDEILWKTFDSANLLLPGGGLLPWMLAAVAALCTAFYMFRSYYMTFSGEYRGTAEHAEHGTGGHGHAEHGAPEPHESPRVMTWVLAILAALAAVGGLIGLPHAWHLPNLFEHWLEPVFESSQHLIRGSGHGTTAEFGLMALSVAVAFAGFLVARHLYRDAASPVPERLLRSPNRTLRSLYRIVYGKYFVDEAYDWLFVRGTVAWSRVLWWVDARVVDGAVALAGTLGRLCGALQGFLDRWLVDGLVNLVGDAIVQGGRQLRRVQTGRIQTYVYGLLAGFVVLLVFAYVMPW